MYFPFTYINVFLLSNLPTVGGVAVDTEERDEGKDAVSQTVISHCFCIPPLRVAGGNECDKTWNKRERGRRKYNYMVYMQLKHPLLIGLI